MDDRLLLPHRCASLFWRLPHDQARPPKDCAAAIPDSVPTSGSARMSALLTVSDVTKRFGAFAALDRCSVSFERGMITGLNGPNGAGNTTLLNGTPGFA